MNFKVLTALGLSVSASTCTFREEYFTGKDCVAANKVATNIFPSLGVGSCAKAEMQFNSATWVAGTLAAGTAAAPLKGTRYIKIDYCSGVSTTLKDQSAPQTEKGGVYFHTYGATDTACATSDTVQPYSGGSTTCTNLEGNLASHRYFVQLSGNPYGLGWFSGITLFICQTMLFGLICGGA